MSLFLNGLCIGSSLFILLMSIFWIQCVIGLMKQENIAMKIDGEWKTGSKGKIKILKYFGSEISKIDFAKLGEK